MKTLNPMDYIDGSQVTRPANFVWIQERDNRGGRIRTGDPLLPKQVRYRTAPRPDVPPNPAVDIVDGSPPASLFAASATARPGPEPDYDPDGCNR